MFHQLLAISMNSTNDSYDNFQPKDAIETWTHNQVIAFLAFEGVIFILNVVCGVIVMCSKRVNKRPPNIILGSMCFTESFVILQTILMTITGRFGVDISCATILFLYGAARISILLHVQLLTSERLVATCRPGSKIFKKLTSRTGRVLSIILANILSVILMVPIYVSYCAVAIHERCKYSEVFGENDDSAIRYFSLLNCTMFVIIIVEYICLAKMLKSKFPKIEPKNRLQVKNYDSNHEESDNHNGIVSDEPLPGPSIIEEKDIQNDLKSTIEVNDVLNDVTIITNSAMACIPEENGHFSNTTIGNEKEIQCMYQDRNKDNLNYDIKRSFKREIVKMEITENEPETTLENSTLEHRKQKNVTVFKQTTTNKIAEPMNTSTCNSGGSEWRKTVFRTITIVVVMSSFLCLPYLVTQIMILTTPNSVNKDHGRVVNNILLSLHALMHGIVHLTTTTKPISLCKSCCVN